MNNKNGLLKSILPWLLVLVLIGGLVTFMNQSNSKEIKYSEFVEVVQDEKIKEVEIVPSSLVVDVSGKYTKKADGKSIEVEFTTTIPNTEAEMQSLTSLLNEKGIETTIVDANDRGMFMRIIANILPYVLLLGGMFFIFRMMSQGGGNAKAFDFGNSRAKLEKNQKTRFSDVAGADEEKEELKELVAFLKNPKKFAQMGARIPKGVLLVGPPGTGKTLLARAVSGEASVPYYSISGSEFVEMFVGVGAGRVRDMFKKAKQTAPCIIFIDEIDAVGRQRGAGMGGGHDEREQTLNQLLVEMDGFGPNSGIIVMAATNRPDVLDPALLRPGRFDRQITIGRPDVKGREAILKVHSRNKRLAPEVRLEDIARRTPGFSGADLENLLNESALLAARENRKQIKMHDIDEATDRVMMGPAKKSKVFSKKERRVVAYHEAGHAVVGIKLENAEVVHKVTIIPRGEAGGYALMLPEEETFLQTKQDLLDRITGLLAGRVSEEITFHEVTTGAHNDFQKATGIARAMVTEYGMSDLGPIQYEQRSGNVFLGRDYNKDKNFSDHLARQIDEQVQKIISSCYDRCRQVLLSNQDLVKLIAETLLEYETLTKEQIDELVEKGRLEETAYNVNSEKESAKQNKFKLVRDSNYKLKSTLTLSNDKLPVID